MSLSSRPPGTNESLLCDACGNTRTWGAWNRVTGAVICTTCIAKKGTPRTAGGSHAQWVAPSDAVSRHTPDALKAIQDI